MFKAASVRVCNGGGLDTGGESLFVTNTLKGPQVFAISNTALNSETGTYNCGGEMCSFYYPNVAGGTAINLGLSSAKGATVKSDDKNPNNCVQFDNLPQNSKQHPLSQEKDL